MKVIVRTLQETSSLFLEFFEAGRLEEAVEMLPGAWPSTGPFLNFLGQRTLIH